MTFTSRGIHSLVTDDATVEISVVESEVPDPGDGQVVIEVGASPINPSDLGLLLAGADRDSLANEHGTLVGQLSAGTAAAMAARRGQSLPVGNEGAGIVVAAGADAQHLMGRTVAVLGGSMYGQYRLARADDCLVLADGTAPVDAASCFVNPLTALGMVETMRSEGHTALVHTAAASNLGQMLQRICLDDGVQLVNIVRRDDQAQILRGLGASYVCNSSSDSFVDDLTSALVDTGATIAFDAIGGGELASTILTCMERAAVQTGSGYSRYGSTTHKQLYIYGGLDVGPTTLRRGFGMAWGMGGWLLPYFLEKAGAETATRLRQRVADELTTTFASHYTDTISLDGVLDPDIARKYARMATGEKYLVTPHA